MNQVLAQSDAEVDSLINLMENESDSIFVKASNALYEHFIDNDPETSLFYIQKSLEIAQSKNDLFGIANAYNVIGVYYQRAGQYEKAVEMHIKGLDFYEKAGKLEDYGWGLNNVGTVYLYIGDHKRAAEYLEKAYGIFKKSGYEEGITTTGINLGSTLRKLGRYDEALTMFDECMVIVKSLGLKGEEARILNSIGLLHFVNDKQMEASRAFEKALELFILENDTYAMMTCYSNLGKSYTKMGRYIDAEKSFTQALQMAKKYKNQGKLIRTYQGLVVLNQERKNFERALKYQLLLSQVKDSVLNQQNLQTLNELEAKYQNEKKEREIEKLSDEKEISELKAQQSLTNRNMVIAGSLLTFLITLLIVNRFRQKQQHRRNQLEIKNLDIQQRLLRAQMNPHFIFNSLNSIQSYISENEPLIAEEYLIKFSGLMRLTLESTSQEYIMLEEEIQMLTLYLELEQMRFDNGFQFEIAVTEEINIEETELPAMISQPFVENAVLHGLRQKKEGAKVKVKYWIDTELLYCSIIDNGIGRVAASKIHSNKNRPHQSRGTEVTLDRLERMKNETGLNIGLSISDLKDEHGKAQGTKVEIRLPFRDF